MINRWRTAGMLVGFVLVILAVVQLNSSETVLMDPPLGDQINAALSLQLGGSQNALIGSGLLLVAAVVIGFSLGPYAPLDQPLTEKGVLSLPWSAFQRRDAAALAVGGVLFAILMAFLLNADASAWLVALWLIPIGILLYVTLSLDRRAGTRLAFRMARADWLWMLGLFAAGLALGVWQLGQIPNLVVGDEGGFYQRAVAILAGQESQSFFGPAVYTYPLPSSLLQAAVIGVAGPTLESWRLASVLPAVLTVLPLYVFVRTAFGRWPAILSCLALISLPYFLAYARLGYNNAQAIPFVTLTVVLIYAGVRRRSLGLSALAGVAAGLGFYTYTAGRLGAVIAGLYLAALVLVQLVRYVRLRATPLEGRQAFRSAIFLLGMGVVLVVTTLVVALPNIVFTNTTEPGLLNHKMFEALLPNEFYVRSLFPNEDIFRDYSPITMGDQTLFFRADLYAVLVLRGIIRTLLAFHLSELNTELFMVGPLAGYVGAVFYVVGLIVAVRRIRRPAYALLLLWWGGGVVLLSVINTFPPRPQHMIPIVPVIAVFIGLGIVVCAHVASQLVLMLAPAAWPPREKLQRWLSHTAMVALIALVAVSGAVTYFVDMPPRYPRDIEMLMSFDAMEAGTPARYVWLTSRTDRFRWSPWMIDEFAPEVEFDLITVSAPGRLPALLAGDQPVTIYFEDADYEAVMGLMRCLLPGVEPVQGEWLNGDRPAWTLALNAAVPSRDIHECATVPTED